MANVQTDNTKALDDYSSGPYEDEINLDELLGILVDGKWLIILITLIFLFAGISKTIIDKPVYKADVLLQINETSQKLAGLDSLSDFLNTKLPVMAEIELIKSRMVLGAAVRNLNLDIIAKPKYFPLIGEPIARRFNRHNLDNAVSSPLFSHPHYAWGGEAIRVDSLGVPADWEDKELILMAGKQGHYQLIDNGEIILEGEVGKPASSQLGHNKQSITIFVSQLKCRPGTQFSVARRSLNSAINHLRANLTVAEKGKGTGILEITMESDSPDSAVQILDEIANIYVRQNIEHKSSESQKTLEFLEKQLPILKEQLETAADALNNYRNIKGSIDLDLETQNILKEIVEIRTQTTLLQQKRDELRQRYTESHPKVVAIDKQIYRLKEQMRSNNDMVKSLPETQQVILGLSGDVQVTSSLYSSLLNNVQTLRVAKAGTVGDVRIIDNALLPGKAIKPKKRLIVGAAFVLGLFFGIAAVFLRKFLHRGIEDPDLIEKQVNIPVYAAVPHSNTQKVIDAKQKKALKNHDHPSAILALEKTEDASVESLRSLRTTIHFAMLEARNNIILITGPSPGVGKTFISTNLAIVMADAGKKILLIDGDIRKGSIHNMFGVSRENGLSEIISNTVSVKEAIRQISLRRKEPFASIDFIPTGAIPPNPSELLLHENFGVFLNGISEQYDLVIIDSAPILAATDPAIIGSLASATFMVVKAGMHTMREIEQSKKRFVQNGVNINGIIFNDMPKLSSRYGYGKYVYQYSYG